jgi:hypothetical protein
MKVLKVEKAEKINEMNIKDSCGSLRNIQTYLVLLAKLSLAQRLVFLCCLSHCIAALYKNCQWESFVFFLPSL